MPLWYWVFTRMALTRKVHSFGLLHSLIHSFTHSLIHSFTNDVGMVAESLLTTLLGGGDMFSAGGPGKGMYSRLYQVDPFLFKVIHN